MTYKEQMRDPKWIEFAHDFKKARNWTCEVCGTRQKLGDDLTVHHIYYLSFVKVWEHPESLLECLCWDCHKRQQRWQQEQLAAFAKKLKGKENPKRAKKIAKALKDAEKIPDRPVSSAKVNDRYPDGDLKSTIFRSSEPAIEPESPIPEGFNPYPEYLQDKAKWDGIVDSLKQRFPIQSAYLSEGGFEGVDENGRVKLRFTHSNKYIAHSFERPAIRSVMEECIREVFPNGKFLQVVVLPEPEKPIRKLDFSAMRQMLGG